MDKLKESIATLLVLLQINTGRNKISKKYLPFVQCTYMIFSKTVRSFKKFLDNEYII